jgi:Zn-dependent metalloprotease
MTCRHLMWALLVGLVAAGPVWAFTPSSSVSDYEVRLPLAQVSPPYASPTDAEAVNLVPAMGAFRSQQGAGWRVLQWNPTLETPSTMGGPAIPMVAPGASSDEIRAAIEAFVARNAELLKVDPQQVRITSITDVGDQRQFVIMGQFVNGLEVINGRLDFALWQGKLVLVGSDAYSNINVNMLATVDEASAIQMSHFGIPQSPSDGPAQPARLVILPIHADSGPVYHLAWEVYMKTQSPDNLWRTYVDAHNGTILWREAQYQEFDITGNVHGQVEMKTVYAPPQYTDIGLPDEKVTANTSYNGYTGATGAYTVTVPDNTTYSMNTQLSGRWCNVNRLDGSDASLTQNGAPGAPVDFMFDDTNSHPAERDIFYHINKTHEWIKGVAPVFTYLDHAVVCYANSTAGTCNAFWNGSNITFYKEGGGCNNSGRIADVISHEYGHGITQGLYTPNSPPNGSGMGEGFSDIYAMTIHGDPIVGENFTTGGGVVRNGENTRQYPGTECAGEVHCLGEIIMGAMWKTRKNFMLRYGNPTRYDQLMIQTVAAKTTTMPGYLNRLLVNDDTDGNLANGTTDWYEICDAFAIHNMPCPALTNYVTVTSAPIDDQPQESGGYMVTATAVSVGPGTISQVRAFYTTDGQTWLTADLPSIGGDQFQGEIPHVDCGSHVRYYVKAEKATGESATAPFLAPYRGVYEFMAGQYLATSDDLEQERGWIVHPATDTATQGNFQRAIPLNKYNSQYGDTQPGEDHTPNGTRCFVTDSIGGLWYAGDVDQGKTSVVSPRLQWRGKSIAEVRYWAFYFDIGPTDDTLRCAVSTDDGATWTDVKKTIGSGLNAWNQYKAFLEDATFGFTDSTRIRFQMEDTGTQSGCAEAAIDDIEFRTADCFQSDVAQNDPRPTRFTVEQNRPNPFNPRTSIKFGLPTAGRVSIEIFDAGGRKIRTLMNGTQSAGFHSAVWDGRDDANRSVGSGVYYYTVKTGDDQVSRKMLLLK